MGKKGGFLMDDDEFDKASRNIEGSKKTPVVPIVEPISKQQGEGVRTEEPKVVALKETKAPKRKQNDLHKAGKKYSRTKSILWDADANIPEVHREEGMTHGRIYKAFVKPLAKMALDKTTQSQDLINIAIYKLLLQEGYVKAPKAETASDKAKETN